MPYRVFVGPIVFFDGRSSQILQKQVENG